MQLIIYLTPFKILKKSLPSDQPQCNLRSFSPDSSQVHHAQFIVRRGLIFWMRNHVTTYACRCSFGPLTFSPMIMITWFNCTFGPLSDFLITRFRSRFEVVQIHMIMVSLWFFKYHVDHVLNFTFGSWLTNGR